MTHTEADLRTWRTKVRDLVYDIRHPVATFQREIALRYCRRTHQRLVSDHVHVAFHHGPPGPDGDANLSALTKYS